METEALQMISSGGEAFSLLLESLAEYRQGNQTVAADRIDEAHEKSLEAHKIQTQIMTLEAQDQEYRGSTLIVHAQDILMNAALLEAITKELFEIEDKYNEQISELTAQIKELKQNDQRL